MNDIATPIAASPPEAPSLQPLSHAPPRTSTADGSPALLFERVSKWYGPVIGVNQVTLELRQGITGLVGPNGAGKSTLMRLAAGQLHPDLGTVTIQGHDASSPDAKRLIGYCPDSDAFYEEMTGRQFVLAMARLFGYTASDASRRTDEILDLVDMADRGNRRIRGYSKGMRQRIKLAQALVHDPHVLILDEPMSGIDPIGRQESLALFHKLADDGKCLLISSHELDELEKLTNHVAVMTRGRIAAVGTLNQIREVLNNHPLTVLLRCAQRRDLATHLLGFEEIVSIEFGDDPDLIVKVQNQSSFFRRLNHLVLEEAFDIQHLQTLDASADAVLGYLLAR